MSFTMKQMLIAIVLAFVFAGIGVGVYYYYSHSTDSAADEFDMMDDHRNAMRMEGDVDTAIVYDDMNSN